MENKELELNEMEELTEDVPFGVTEEEQEENQELKEEK